MRGDLMGAQATVTELAGALERGDTAHVERAMATLRRQARAASDRTGGPTWRTLSVLPGLGDDFDAVARASRALELITTDGVGPLVDAGFDPAAFAPQDGRVPAAEIAASAEPLARAADGLRAAEAEIAPIDTDRLAHELRPRFEDLQEAVAAAADAVDGARRAAAVLPTMLGSEEERTYLVIFQNTAEVRALGGMPGIMTTLTATDGRLTMGEPVAASTFGQLGRPVLPLTEEEREVWDAQPGTWFQDSVFIPDFPRASELMAARWRLETGREVDGVLSVDPASLALVLHATGPVVVDGTTLTADNVIDELLHETYLRTADDFEAQDAYFSDVASEVFDTTMSGTGDATALVSALTRASAEGRLLVHSFDESEQSVLSGTRLAGEFPADPDGPPEAAVYVNDATGSKMSYFLRFRASVGHVSCAGGRVSFDGLVRARSLAFARARRLPAAITGGGAYGVAAGDQIDVFDLVGPVGGTIEDVTVDGRAVDPEVATFRGRPVAEIPLLLGPRDRARITWRVVAAPGKADEVRFVSTPGLRRGGDTVRVPSPCA